LNMRFRAGYTGFRTFFAIVSMTLVLTCGVAAKAEPEGAVPPEPAQAQSESGSTEGHGTSPVGEGQTEAQGAGTAPEDAQTEADPSAAETPPEDAAAGTDATPPEDAAGSDATPSEDAAAGTESKPSEDAAAGPEVVPEEPASKILITVDKEAQHMTVWVDGVEQYSWPVSTGMRGYSTPSGDYTASSMNEIWYSKQWDNAPMPHAIFFTKKGHAIHGSSEVKRLGTPASHGCVRVSPANAKTLYALVKEKGLKNTEVVLTGVTPGGEAKVAEQPRGYQRYGDAAPWFQPGQGYYYPQQRRRGLFGRRWSQPSYGPQGYYRPRGYPPGY
jgi:lipoprotein-anchoring transpeptidase ErfK/SrfK